MNNYILIIELLDTLIITGYSYKVYFRSVLEK